MFEEIVRLSWAFGARGRGGAALQRIARIDRERGELEAALEHLRAALALFGSVGDQPRRGQQLRRHRADPPHARRARDRAGRGRTRRCEIRMQAPRPPRASRVTQHDRPHRARPGQYDDAEARFGKALEIRLALPDHEGAVQTRIHLGQLAFRARSGRRSGARVPGRARERARAKPPALPGLRAQLPGRGVSRARRHDRADRALREAKRLAGALRDQNVLGDIDRNLANLAARREAAAKPGAPRKETE